jgi:hypothetical protein
MGLAAIKYPNDLVSYAHGFTSMRDLLKIDVHGRVDLPSGVN